MIGWDTALSDRNSSSMQMLGHGCPMYIPSSDEILHAVAGLILLYQPLDLLLGEPPLHLPHLSGLRPTHPTPQQARQLLGQPSELVRKVRTSSP